MKLDITFEELNVLIKWGGDHNSGWPIYKRLKEFREKEMARLTELRNTVASMKKEIAYHSDAVRQLLEQLDRAEKEIAELENS